MFQNYLIVALRNFWRSKLFSLIYMASLSIGISASLVIFLIVQYHLSFDRFEQDRDRIYRVVSDFKFSGQPGHNSGVTDPLAEAVQREVTGVESVVAFHLPNFDVKVTLSPVKNGPPVKYKKQNGIIFANSSYVNLLGYHWLVGSPEAALKEPFQVVLTRRRAQQYFPDLPLHELPGKVITYNDSIHATVSGVVEDLSHNTDFTFKEFISHSTIRNSGWKDSYSFDDWGSTSSGSQLFIKINKQSLAPQIEKQLNGLLQKYNKSQKQDSLNAASFRLQPLGYLHFDPDYGTFDDSPSGTVHKSTLYGLLILGVFLLLLGCINFINLATARSSQRAKEIGIRKTMGSSKTQLRMQFLTETFLITTGSALLSLLASPLLLHVFSDFIPGDLQFNVLKNPQVIVFLLVLILAVTFLSGFYPAILLSGYNPALVLKSQAVTLTGKTRKASLRKILTVSQFAIAQIFIMGSLIVGRQIQYSLQKDLGFKKDAIVFFNADYFDPNPHNKTVLAERLRLIPEISSLSLSTHPPSSSNVNSTTMKSSKGKDVVETSVEMIFADTNFIPLYHMKLIAGKNLPPSDNVNSFVINEAYARRMGYMDVSESVGKMIEWNDRQVPVVGVVADFHQHSLHEQIQPLVICARLRHEFCFNVMLQPENAGGTVWKTAIEKMQKEYKAIYPEVDFDYSFLDDSIAKFYKTEMNISRLLRWATAMAIFISCLGLLGLVVFTTNTRTKEIGIRKVLGASIAQIVGILSKEFMILIAIAFVIAVPVAWWGTYKWLEDFAYKMDGSWWPFAASGLLMLAIGFLTLSMQTINAARANPVTNLRTE